MRSVSQATIVAAAFSSSAFAVVPAGPDSPGLEIRQIGLDGFLTDILPTGTGILPLPTGTSVSSLNTTLSSASSSTFSSATVSSLTSSSSSASSSTPTSAIVSALTSSSSVSSSSSSSSSASSTTPTPSAAAGPPCEDTENGFNPSAFERLYLRQTAELLAELANIFEIDPQILTGGYLQGIFIQLARTIIRIEGLLSLGEKLIEDGRVSGNGEATPRRLRDRASDARCNSRSAARPNLDANGNPEPVPVGRALEAPPSIHEIFQKLGVSPPSPKMMNKHSSGNADVKIAAREAAPETDEERMNKEQAEKRESGAPASAVSLAAVILAAVALF